MTIYYSVKAFDDMIVSDNTNTRYSDPSLNQALAQAEKFFFQVKSTQVLGTSPNAVITLETSCDNVNWTISSTPISAAIANGTVLFGADLGTSQVRGLCVRIGVKLTGTTPSAYIEVWITGRSLV